MTALKCLSWTICFIIRYPETEIILLRRIIHLPSGEVPEMRLYWCCTDTLLTEYSCFFNFRCKLTHPTKFRTMRIPKKVEERFSTSVTKFKRVLKKALDKDVNESDTVSIVTDILADVFGYDKYEEVTSEYQIKHLFCDLAIKINKCRSSKCSDSD